jgi:IS5 family transposase
MMFKALVLQRLYNLSDHQMQFQLLDRLSFQRFLGLGLYSQVPDEKTIWSFRETLTQRGIIEKLFEKFQEHLQQKGLLANRGSIIDATFVEVPCRGTLLTRTTRSRPGSHQLIGPRRRANRKIRRLAGRRRVS